MPFRVTQSFILNMKHHWMFTIFKTRSKIHSFRFLITNNIKLDVVHEQPIIHLEIRHNRLLKYFKQALK